MRLTRCAAVLSILLLAGCPAGSLGTGGAGGAGPPSPGTVTLQVTLPPGQTFCDENPSCTSTQHLWLTTASGEPLTLGGFGCGVNCETCAAIPCPETATIACLAGNWGVAVTNSGVTWDGSYTESGTCEPRGASAAIACTSSRFAPAGKYVARFCATPGTLSTSDGGAAVCTATGPQECLEMPFAFPSSLPVVITLPRD
jgi:hypothetical protein